jgi:DNA adenine methylase
MLKPLQSLPWSTPPRPFLKWAGGKGQLLDRLERFLPKTFGTYFEPFLGGAAVFFFLVGSGNRFSAVLSDTNEELITTYGVVKEDVEALILKLKEHARKYKSAPENYFYEVRKSEPANDLEKAARLLFLNKTCFNGLYRVNSKGKFNVPFGKYKNPKIVDESNLRAVSSVLKWSQAQLLPLDYRKATESAKEGDFVYFDPPYQPSSSTANFTSYTKSGFSMAEQEELATLFKKLHEKGCYVLLSNSNTEDIISLYKNIGIKELIIEVVPALRAINCKGNLRKGHTELIITTKSLV